jgi:hypothetical protein
MNDEARVNLEPIEKMVDGLGAGTVFGEPIREGGVTVVPVAEVRFAFGYGYGSGRGRGEEAEGGPRMDEGSGGGSGAGGPLPKATFASLPMRSGSSRYWTSRALRWLASPSRLGVSSGSPGRCALLAREAEDTCRML